MFEGTYVINLTTKDFGMDRIIHKDFNPIGKLDSKKGLVVFYKPTCPWCQKMKDEYIKAAKFCKGVIAFGAIDGGDRNNSVLMSRYNIKSFPTIKLVNNGYITDEEFNDNRTSTQFVKFMCDRMPNDSKNQHICN